MYFTDFWGESDSLAKGSGGIWRLFPSDDTLELTAAENDDLKDWRRKSITTFRTVRRPCSRMPFAFGVRRS